MRVCLKSVKKIIPNVVEVISSSGYIFPGVVKKGRVFFLASIVNTSPFFFFVLGNNQHLFDSTTSFLLPKEEIVAHLPANIPPVESLCWGVRGKLAVPSEIAA